jgi:hypothetical protein
MSAQTAIVHFKNSLSSYDNEAGTEFTSVGLDASGQYVSVTDANYIASASHITEAIELLDDALKNVETSTYTIVQFEQQITNLKANVPEILDTLDEIAASLGDDANFAANLVTSITNRSNAAKAAELTIRTDLSGEIVRATAEELRIAGLISVEEARALAAEQVIRDNLASKVASSLSADATISASYDTMVSDRVSALANLDTSIRATTTTRDTAANEALTAEIARAIAAEDVLRTDLSGEIVRATGAETTLTNNLSAEVSRATNKENEIETNLTAEVNRATAAEDALSARIGTVETNYIKMDGSVAFTENMSMGGRKIIGVANPTDAADLVNKQYVDLGVSNLGNAFEYVGDVTIVSGTPYNMASLGTVEKPLETGDAYKIIGAGQISTSSGNLNVKDGDIAVYNGTTWDIFNNSDILVQPTANRIAVSGNSFGEYTVDIDAAYVGQASINTVGTISSGTYQGDVIATAYGGLGQSSFARGDLLLGNASGSLNVLPLGSAGKMLKYSSGTAAWIPESTANFTLTSGLTSGLVDGTTVVNDLGLSSSSTVQEAIDGLYNAIQKRKYVQYVGPVNSGSYETYQSSLLNGKVHFMNKTVNGFVMLPGSADENTVIRIVNNEDPSIPSLETEADDNDILVKYNDGSADVEVAYIAPKDTMVFIYNSAQTPKWMVGVGI